MYKFTLYLLIFFGFFFRCAYSEDINSIEINGNNRISDETILVFSGINITKEINSSSDLNKILKDLYDTNYFSNVDVDFKDNKLIINVIENPIIQSVQINGIKAKKSKTLSRNSIL